MGALALDFNIFLKPSQIPPTEESGAGFALFNTY